MPEIIHAPDFAKLPGIRHGFYTAAWGRVAYLSAIRGWAGWKTADKSPLISAVRKIICSAVIRFILPEL